MFNLASFCQNKTKSLFYFFFHFISRWLSNTIAASSALLCLPSFPWKPPTFRSASSTGRISHSPHLPYVTVIPPARSRRAPCPAPSSVYPPPLQFKRPACPAPSYGPPDPAAPPATSGAFGAAAPSARDAAEDGGSEAEDDAAPHVSISILAFKK